MEEEEERGERERERERTREIIIIYLVHIYKASLSLINKGKVYMLEGRYSYTYISR